MATIHPFLSLASLATLPCNLSSGESRIVSMATACAVSSSLAMQGELAASKSGILGNVVNVPVRAAPVVRGVAVCCRAAKGVETEVAVPAVPRRLALALLASVATVESRIAPAHAAYGESANVFGAAKKQSGFTSYTGEGFKLDIPSKWNPSKEKEFPGTVLRYEDNFDATNNLFVSITPAAKSKISDYGSPEKFLDEVSFLLGTQSYAGKTASEGGFLNNAVATASVLESSAMEVNGKPYYKLAVLTRTADGDEGGKHQLIVATVDNGKLYLFKAQAGDKRWFKGMKKFIEGAANSFSVA